MSFIHYTLVGHFDPRMVSSRKLDCARPIDVDRVAALLDEYPDEVARAVTLAHGCVRCDWAPAREGTSEQLVEFAYRLAREEGCLAVENGWQLMYPPEAARAWAEALERETGTKGLAELTERSARRHAEALDARPRRAAEPTGAGRRWLDSLASDRAMRTETTIRNCMVRMKVVCPETWEKLEETGAPGVRRCNRCERDVYFCRTDAETLDHARAGHCIAREMPHRSELPPVVVGMASGAEGITPQQERAMRAFHRECGIDTLLRGRLEAASRECPSCGYPVPDFRKSCYVCGFEVGRV